MAKKMKVSGKSTKICGKPTKTKDNGAKKGVKSYEDAKKRAQKVK